VKCKYTEKSSFHCLSQEAIAVGRSFATIRGYKLDGNKEMIAMGFSNVAGSLSSCYVATGDH
jgi:sulfate transporter 2, low-affinity